MWIYEELRLHFAKGSHTGVAVTWVHNDSAVIAVIERGPLPQFRSDRTFASAGQASEAAHALWLASLETRAGESGSSARQGMIAACRGVLPQSPSRDDVRYRARNDLTGPTVLPLPMGPDDWMY